MPGRKDHLRRRTERLFVQILEPRRFFSGTVLYVDQSAPSGGDGSSWPSAFSDLQPALLAAAGSSDSPITIEVARGTYYPTSVGDPTATFQLLDDVSIVGGYATGGSTNPDFAANPTILSGQLNPNGGLNGNSYNVVTGSGVDNTAVLDGFSIEHGNAAGSGGQVFGGGMFNEIGSPTVENCTFTNNYASLDGGGMANLEASPNVINCTFISNTAVTAGAMVNLVASPTITNCSFISNTATGGATSDAGAIGNIDYSSPTLIDCVFQNNSSPTANTLGGGAVLNDYYSLPTFINCSFSGNSASEGAAIDNVENATATITNCILYGDTAPTGNEIDNDSTSSAAVNYSDVDQSGLSGSSNLDYNPLFTDTLSLQSNSPCINTGSNAAIEASGVNTDLAGNPRVVFGTVDMGAYEFQPISIAWTDSDSGTSWTDAADWSGGQVPNSFDAVTIGPSSFNLQIPAGAFSVYSLTSSSALTLLNGATLQIASASVLNSSLTIQNGATLDITGASLAINYSSPAADPIDAIRFLLTGGANFSGNSDHWNGSGIISSTAAASSGKYTVGYLDGNNPIDSLYHTVAANQIIVKVALTGDAFLQNSVGFSDLLTVAQNYQQTGRDFAEGNFDYNASQSVGFADLLSVAQNYGQTFSSSGEILPPKQTAIFPAATVATNMYSDQIAPSSQILQANSPAISLLSVLGLLN